MKQQLLSEGVRPSMYGDTAIILLRYYERFRKADVKAQQRTAH